MEAPKPNATRGMQARIDATVKGLIYQWAEVWLERNPEATAKELLLFLAELAEKARREAIMAEMSSGKLDELEAAELVDRYMDYRDSINRELDGKHHTSKES